MAKIKAGQVHTAGTDAAPVHIENTTERGGFEVHLLGKTFKPEQARKLAEILTSAADKAEILDAAMEA